MSLTFHDLDVNDVDDILNKVAGSLAANSKTTLAPVAAPLVVDPVAFAGQPAVVAPTVSANVQGLDLDSTGIPWDERIHAGTKGKNKDGSWKGKRGVDDATIASVTAELKAMVANQNAAIAPAPVATGNVPGATFTL